MRRILASGVLGLAVLGVAWAWFAPSQAPAGAAPYAADEYCAPIPADAKAGPADPADVRLSAVVPLETPAVAVLATGSVAVTQGDVVRVSVNSPRAGGVAVHGLLDVHPIAAQGRVTVEFRAIYSGRFPVHFHGADGSHFEIAVMEVMPQSVAALR